MKSSQLILLCGSALHVLGVGNDCRAQSSDPKPIYELVWIDRHGTVTAVDTSFRFRLTEYGGNRGWAISPDGRKVAIGVNTNSGDDVWIKDLVNGSVSRLTSDTTPEFRPRWANRGRSVTF